MNVGKCAGSPVVTEGHLSSGAVHEDDASTKLPLNDVEEFPPMWLAVRKQPWLSPYLVVTFETELLLDLFFYHRMPSLFITKLLDTFLQKSYSGIHVYSKL